MESKVPPAIRREYTSEDNSVDVMSTPKDTVTFHRGLGDSGYRIEVVDKCCPHEHCSFDRMVRRHDVNPESRDTVKYWCLSPNCQHFVGSVLSYACHNNYPQRPARSPIVYE